MRKFTYRPWSFLTEDIRTDGCYYHIDNVSFTGLFQLNLRSKKHPDQVFFVMRRLVTAETNPE